MDTFRDPWAGFVGHEQVVVGFDEATGMRAIVAIHSTALGPALGGTRMSDYRGHPDPMGAAYADALRLSQAMSLKNALAGLPHGGGKAVLVADPATKHDELLHAYGRFLATLGGRYITACDLGMLVEDMDVIAETNPWTTGRSPERGGVGDSGILTAVGVWRGMQAAAAHIWGEPSLRGRKVGILGAGKVGGRLAQHLLTDGAEVYVVDPHPAAQAWLAANAGDAQLLPDIDSLLAAGVDVLSPNATGGVIDLSLAQQVTVALICGGANNQLADPAAARILADRGIVYTPDFMVNCGGVIQVAEELAGGDLDRARSRTERVFHTTAEVLVRAESEGLTPVEAAQRQAFERIAAGG
jgi:valine dehydrogenase (NAD+)